MVSRQIKARGIKDKKVLEAFQHVPRHFFVPKSFQNQAYEDYPLRIGHGQTISQPYIVALMTSLLQLEGNEKVLEIGTGSGYQAAILSRLTRIVHTVERLPGLIKNAQTVLDKLEIENVHIHEGDGSMGWPDEAPYECILITAAAPRAPQPLLEQLSRNGRLIIPAGSRTMQYLEIWRRKGDEFECERGIPVAFVPLRGEHGWEEIKPSN